MTELLLLFGVKPALTTGLLEGFVKAAVHVGHTCKIFLISGDSSAKGGLLVLLAFSMPNKYRGCKEHLQPKKDEITKPSGVELFCFKSQYY